jgi:surface protein
MEYMFYRAEKFNQPINDWDVSKVTDMSYMFYMAEKFNQPLDKWDTSKVENMKSVFYKAKAYKDHDMSSWNVEKATVNNRFLEGAGTGNTPPSWP